MTQALELTHKDTTLTLKSLPVVSVAVGAVLIGLILYFGNHRLTALEDGHKEIKEELRLMTYMLSLPEDKRPKLAVPPALRYRIVP